MTDEQAEHDRPGAALPDDVVDAALPDDLVDGALRAALAGAETAFSAVGDDIGAARGTSGSGGSDIPASVGRYEVLEEVARGGVGAVLRGRDAEIGREVAIKLLLDEHAGNPDMARRLIEEGRIAGQLQHPGIVPVHELGRRADRRPFFTMKLVRGETLASLLARRRNATERRQHYLRIVMQVCEAVAYAHARGIVHRDLKPMNVMIGAFGEVQVMDWGLAKVLATDGAAAASLTVTENDARTNVGVTQGAGAAEKSVAGVVMGTPAYMAPEQARGEPGAVDRRTDVFGLGAILCEALTGRPPYAAPSVAQVLAVARSCDISAARAALESSGADAALVALALRCLSAEKESRPRDAGEVSEALRAYLDSLEERARSLELTAARARVRAESERQARIRTFAAAMIVLFVLAALIAVTGLLVARSEREKVGGTLEREARAALAALDERLENEERRVFERFRAVDFAGAQAAELVRALARDSALVAQPFALRGNDILWPPGAKEQAGGEVPWKNPATSATERALVDAVYEHRARGRREDEIFALQAIVHSDDEELSFAVRAESSLRLAALLAAAPDTREAAVLEIDRLLAAGDALPPASAHEALAWRFAALDRKVELLDELGRDDEAMAAAVALLAALADPTDWRRHAGPRGVYLPRLRARGASVRRASPADIAPRWNDLLTLAAEQERESGFRRELERDWLPRLAGLASGETPRALVARSGSSAALLVVAPGPHGTLTLGFLAEWPYFANDLAAVLSAMGRADGREIACGIVDQNGSALAGAELPGGERARLVQVDAPRLRPWRLWLDPEPLCADAERKVFILFGAFLAVDLALLAVFAAEAARGALARRRDGRRHGTEAA